MAETPSHPPDGQAAGSSAGRRHRYRQLLRIGQLITSEMDFGRLFAVIAEQTNRLLGTEAASVFLADDGGTHLTAFVSTDLERGQVSIPADVGVAGSVFRHRQPLVVDDAERDRRFFAEIDRQTGFKTRSILCVPLIRRDSVCIGTFQALNKTAGRFTEDDREVMGHLANYVTVAVENCRLYERLSAAQRAKERAVNRLSHELRTPLAILLSALRQIERGGQGLDAAARRALERGRRSLVRLAGLQQKVDDIVRERPGGLRPDALALVENLADLAEGLAGEEADEVSSGLAALRAHLGEIFHLRPPVVEPIALGDFVRQLVAGALPAGLRDYPELRLELQEGLTLAADRGVLEKAVIGLLKNAVENTPDGGLVTVIAAESDSELFLEVRDTGVGIVEADMDSVFGGFFQERSTEQYASGRPFAFNAGGAGLDLLRIRTFAERFGFGIEVESRRCPHLPSGSDLCPGKITDCRHIDAPSRCRENGGSRFRLRFPKTGPGPGAATVPPRTGC